MTQQRATSTPKKHNLRISDQKMMRLSEESFKSDSSYARIDESQMLSIHVSKIDEERGIDIASNSINKTKSNDAKLAKIRSRG